MSDLQAQIKIGADASGVETGVGKAKRSLADLGQTVKRTSAEGTGAFEAIGDSSTKSAKAIETATRNSIQSIQRQIAAYEAGSKTAREYQESLARQRGVDVNSIKPYLDQLDAVKAKQMQAGKAAEYLAAGLNAVRFAAVAVATFVTGLVLSVNNGVDALNDLKDATGASIENISALEDIGARTGTSFETVSTALIKFNQALSTAKPGSDAEKAIKAIGLNVKELKALDPAEAFQKVAIALNGFDDDANKARLTQELFGKSLKEVAPLLKDTAEAGKLVATVTTAQAEAAETFNKQLFAFKKNSLDASRALLNDLLPALTGVAQELNVGTKNAGGFLNAILLIGTTNPFNTLTENVQKYREQIAGLEEDKKRYLNAGSDTRAIDDALRAAKQRLAYFQELRQLENEKGISASDQTDAEARRLGLSSSRKSVGDISGGDDKALAAANKELAEQAKLLLELNGLSGTFTEDWNRLATIFGKGKISLEQLTAAQAALLAKQPAVKANIDAQAKAQEALNKAQTDAAAASNKELFGLRDANEALRLKNETIGLSEDALNALTLKRMDLTIAVQEGVVAEYADVAAMDELNGTHNANVEVMQREIDKLAELKRARELTAAGQQATIAAKAAKDTLSAWEKTAEKIGDNITDALMRGFESGKSIAENLRDTIVNMFKTMVLRPVNQAVVMGGIGGNASAGQGGAGNPLSTIKSLWDMGSSLFNGDGFSSLVTSGVGNLANTATAAGFTNFGASLGKYAGTIGDYAEVMGEGLGYLSSIKSATEGKWGQAIGAAAGTYFFGPLGGMVGSSIGSFVDGLFSGGGYVSSTGDSARYYNADGSLMSNTASNGKDWWNNTAGANNFVDSLQAKYLASAKALGIGTVATEFSFGSNNSDGGKFSLGGGATGRSGVFQAETKTSDEALSLAASRAVFAALQGSDLPAYLSKVFNGIDAQTATQEQINGTYQFAESLKALRFSLLDTTEQAAEYQKAVDAGTAELGTSAKTFKKDFLAALDAGLTPESLAKWQALGANLQALDQIVGQTATAVDVAVEKFKSSMTSLSSTGFDLENQILQLTGNGSEAAQRIRAAEIARLTEGITDQDKINQITAQYDYNESLRAQIASLNAAAQAQQNYAAEQQSYYAAQLEAANSAAEAARQIKDAWQSATDNLMDEVARIRGTFGTSEQNFASAQARFSIAAAQANAGSQSAANALPELSRALLGLAEQDAGSIAELRFIQARTAGTLEEISKKFAAQFGLQIPQFAVGTNYVPQDMLAVVHKGEAIIPAAYNPAESGAQVNTGRLEALVQVLIERVEALEAPLSRTAAATEDTAITLDSATEGGNAMRTVVMEPIPA